MEKGNATDGGRQDATPTGSASRTGTVPDTTTSAGPGTGTGTAPKGTPAPSGSPGGGSAAGSAPSTTAGTTERKILHQGSHEETYPDGSRLRLDGQGGAEFQQGPNTARLQGHDWVDPKTGQRVDRGLWASADHRLRELEIKRGLRR